MGELTLKNLDDQFCHPHIVAFTAMVNLRLSSFKMLC